MKIKGINRNSDVIYGSRDLETLYTFKKFPVFMGVTNKDIRNDKFFKMRWQISKGSGMLQLNPLLPLNILYPESHNAGYVGKLWEKHHHEFAKFIFTQKPKNVLEIGACHGILFKKFLEFKKKIKWTIIEPNPKIEKGINVKIIKSFFDSKSKIPKDVDTFVHSHVIEHIYDLHKFISDLKKKISIKKKMIFSVPNLEIMLKKKYTNCINFEHTIFLTQPFIKYFLSIYGFKIVKKKFFKKNHSIFYACVKTHPKVKKIHKLNFYAKYKKIYLDYILYHERLIKKLNIKIKNTQNPIFLFGAHVFSQYLLNFGLNSKKIKFILDNDITKQNKRLYGSNLFVRSPKILSKFNKPIVVLKVAAYENEIKRDILYNINKNTKFL